MIDKCQDNHCSQEFPSKWDILTSSTQLKPSLNSKVAQPSNKNNNTSEIPLNIKSWLETQNKPKDVHFYPIFIVINLRECFKFNQRKYVEFCLAHKAPGTSLEEAAKELGYIKWSVYQIISYLLLCKFFMLFSYEIKNRWRIT